MASNMSFSLQERDSDSSLNDLDNLENLVEEYRPILEDQGYQYTREDVGDHHLATGHPQNRAVTSKGNRLCFGQRNGDHYHAWLTSGSALSNLLVLEDTELNTKDDDKPPVPAHPSLNEITRKELKFSPCTMCLEKILLSDGSDWSFLFDDIIHINCDVMSRLADLHAESIVHCDVRAGNIYINDYMRAFLIDSPRFKKEQNKARLMQESTVDVKELCKVMGGLYKFYQRNKPLHLQNGNQEAETALFCLLQRGYRKGMTAKYFLQEIGHIVQGADGKLTEQDVPQKVEKKMEKKGGPELLAVSKRQDSRTINNPISQPCAAVVNNQGLLLGSAVITKQGPVLGSLLANNQRPELGSPVVKNHGSELGTTVGIKPGPELGSLVVQNPGRKLGTVVANKQDPKLESPVVQNPSAELETALASKQGQELGSLVVQNPGPKLGTVDANKQDPELESPVVQNPSPELGTALASKQDQELRSSFVKNPGPELGTAVIINKEGAELGSSVSIPSGHQELRSGDMVNYHQTDREGLSDEASTLEKLMSELELEMFLSS